MVSELETAPIEAKDQTRCCHYWVVETPNGPTSRGICRFCGEEKQFQNSQEDL
jgi:hypothetical protein